MNFFYRNRENPKAAEPQERKYIPGQQVRIEKVTPKGDRVNMLAEVAKVEGETIWVKEPYSRTISVINSDGKEEEVEPVNPYPIAQLNEWQEKYGFK